METTDLATGVDPMDALMGALGNGEPAEETTAEVSGEEETTEQPTEQTEEQPAEAAETAAILSLDGKPLEIPPGTPPALVERVQTMAANLKADYTKKTQEVAEIRKASEARLDAIQKQEALFSANAPKVAELQALQARVQQFEQLDWNALAETDPAQATKLHIAYQATQREAGAKYRELQAAENERQQLAATAQAKALEIARAELAKRLPKLDDATKRGIAETAQAYGWTTDELTNVTDPRMVHALHDAMQWRKLQAEKPKALQKVAEAPKVLKPGAAEQRKPNQAALDRLKKHGRVEDLAALL